jgi:hypothetical protein
MIVREMRMGERSCAGGRLEGELRTHVDGECRFEGRDEVKEIERSQHRVNPFGDPRVQGAGGEGGKQGGKMEGDEAMESHKRGVGAKLCLST